MRIGQSYWLSLSQHGRAQGAVKYVNAAVVGLLVATLVFPIIPASVTAYWQIPVIGVSFIWLQRFKPPIWQVITVFLLGAVTASFV